MSAYAVGVRVRVGVCVGVAVFVAVGVAVSSAPPTMPQPVIDDTARAASSTKGSARRRIRGTGSV
jgi:hypothetical protein